MALAALWIFAGNKTNLLRSVAGLTVFLICTCSASSHTLCRPDIIFVAVLWMLSNHFLSFLYYGTQTTPCAWGEAAEHRAEKAAPPLSQWQHSARVWLALGLPGHTADLDSTCCQPATPHSFLKGSCLPVRLYIQHCPFSSAESGTCSC